MVSSQQRGDLLHLSVDFGTDISCRTQNRQSSSGQAIAAVAEIKHISLTEEQMDSDRVRILKSKLLEMKAALEADVDSGQADTVELDQSRVGRLSRMDALQSQQLALEAARHRERRRLAVEGALNRLESGDYGYCYSCSEEIAFKRLSFDPTITRCIGCAS